jgi:hypothetical protein
VTNAELISDARILRPHARFEGLTDHEVMLRALGLEADPTALERSTDYLRGRFDQLVSDRLTHLCGPRGPRNGLS